MAKHLGWAIRPKNTPVAVKLANGTVVHSSDATNGLVLNDLWQAYVTFLVLDVPFEVVLGMLCLLSIFPYSLIYGHIFHFPFHLTGRQESFMYNKGSLEQTAYCCK